MRTLAGRTWAAAATLAAPALRLMLRRRAVRGKEILERLPERFGIEATPRPAGKLLWIHAASVGETVSILPVLAALPADTRTLISTGTVTSAHLLKNRLADMGLQGRVLHRFVPLDVPRWVFSFLDHWRPDAAGFVESELWPNLLAACASRSIPMALINARMSARSFARWSFLPSFAAEMLRDFTWVAAQSPDDADRLRALGARMVTAPGNLKFCAPPLPADPAELAKLQNAIGARPCWLAASTHPGDEEAAARVHAALLPRFPDLLTVIVPRHPARGDAIVAALPGATQRSKGAAPAGGLWIADTLGELGLFYRAIPIVFMAKSFGTGGGQNPLEPARLGCAVASGPSVDNFEHVVAQLTAAGGLTIVADEAALAGWVADMLTNPARRAQASDAAAKAATGDPALPGQIARKLRALIR